jgi:hypothetical protein
LGNEISFFRMCSLAGEAWSEAKSSPSQETIEHQAGLGLRAWPELNTWIRDFVEVLCESSNVLIWNYRVPGT